MEHISLFSGVHRLRRAALQMALAAGAFVCILLPWQGAEAAFETWDPTLLVNTESFISIEDGDGTTDIQLQFGATNQFLQFAIGENTFDLSHSLDIWGDLSVSGSIILNADRDSNATLTFGVPSGSGSNQTFTFDTLNDFRFELSTGAQINGALWVTEIPNCEVVITDAQGRLVCGDGNYLTESEADDIYVNESGDTMTGALIVNDETGVGITTNADVTASGTIKINDDGTGDATLTFGTSSGDETLIFDVSTGTFVLSDDLMVDGSLTVTESGVNVAGIQYFFPEVQGGANQVLANDGSGNLVWQDQESSSGNMISMHAEYPNAIYVGSGANTTGQLKLAHDFATRQNHYRWATTKSTQQSYDIIVRLKLADNFTSWNSAEALKFLYRTQSDQTDDNNVEIRVYDTADALDYQSPSSLAENDANFTALTLTTSDLDGTYTADDYMTVNIRLTSSGANAYVDAGYLDFNWDVN